jgi:hypothetical protein
LRFEFEPINLLLIFPQSAQLEDLFMWMYHNHPFTILTLTTTKDSVIGGSSRSQVPRAKRMPQELIADKFIPVIWADRLAEATKIIEEKSVAAVARSADGSFKELLIERHRFYLCDDPFQISFNLDK